MDYEYKCVGAPEKPRKSRRAKTGSQRLAVSMEELIQEEAVNGWEYMRTDLVPIIEKPGLFSRAQEVHRAVLVFRREIAVRSASRPGSRARRAAPEYDDSMEDAAPSRTTRRMRRAPARDEEVFDDRDPAPRYSGADDNDRPARRRAVPAEEPIRLTADDMAEDQPRRPGRGRERGPPSGLG